jgi:hypothetical protein
MIKSLLPIGGAVIGGMLGGPMGAMAGLSIGTTVAGTMMRSEGAKAQAAAMWAAAQYNAETYRKNAEIVINQAAEDERKFRTIFAKDQGKSRANIGASGITVSGSALDVLEQNARDAEVDALQIRHEGTIRAYSFNRQAELALMEGRAGLRAGRTASSATLLEGAGRIAGQVLTGVHRGYWKGSSSGVGSGFASQNRGGRTMTN